MNADDERHSRAFDAELIRDPVELAKREARNGLRQFDAVVEIIDYWLQPDVVFRLRIRDILHLHRIALDGISHYAGNFRPAGIEIQGSKHMPVGAHLVPGEVEDLCDYVNANGDKSPLHLAAWVLWRLNWIHPFTDGNGRTARAISYFVLCVRLGYRLPGRSALPDLLARNKQPYYDALEQADAQHLNGKLDVSAMEGLLSDLLAKQLLSVHQSATGEVR